MASEPILAALDLPAAHRSHSLTPSRALADYWALTKPEINFLIAITTAAGFWMGALVSLSHFPWVSLFHTLVGTALVSSGAAALNQLLEIRFDTQMRRTARRPLAAGRIEPLPALWFGTLLSLVGVVYLAVATNLLACSLATLTLLGYLFLYTPLKRKTSFCTLVGAVPGAAPPLIGWAAARGHLAGEAWILWAIVFLWQFPHFMSIAWMYREDYARAGYSILPASELRNSIVAWQSLLPTLALLPLTLLPAIRHEAGIVYFAGSLILGSVFLYYSVHFAVARSRVSARRLLFASILYLPALLALLSFDKR